MEGASASLEPLFSFLAHSLSTAERTFYTLPGSAIIERYVRSSHQNDPGRTFLEIVLALLVIRTLLQSRTRPDKQGAHFIDFTDKVSPNGNLRRVRILKPQHALL
jgi:serine palmitoyltransferase